MKKKFPVPSRVSRLLSGLLALSMLLSLLPGAALATDGNEAPAVVSGTLYNGEDHLENNDAISVEAELTWKIDVQPDDTILLPTGLILDESRKLELEGAQDYTPTVDEDGKITITATAPMTPLEPSTPIESEDPTEPESSEEEAVEGSDLVSTILSLVSYDAGPAQLPTTSFTLSVPCKIDPKSVENGQITVAGVTLTVTDAPVDPDTGDEFADPAMTLYIGAEPNFIPATQSDDSYKYGHFDGTALEDGSSIKLEDDLYLLVHWKDLVNVVPEQTYTYTLPKALAVQGDQSGTFKYTSEEDEGKPVADWAVKSATGEVSISFRKEESAILPNLHDVFFSFKNKISEDATAAPEDGTVTIELIGKTYTVKVPELATKPITLEKSGGPIDSNGVVTWTVTYMAPKVGDSASTLVDTLPTREIVVGGSSETVAAMEYVPDSFACKLGESASTDITMPEDATPGTLTFDVSKAEKGKEYTLTYQTRLTDQIIHDLWADTSKDTEENKDNTQTFTNSIQAKDSDGNTLGDPVTDNAILKNSDWNVKNVVVKTGGDAVKVDPETGKCYLSWTIEVKTAGSTFTKLHVLDTLGKGLALDETSLVVKANGVEMDPQPTTSLVEESNGSHLLTIQLINAIERAAEIYTITYNTEVNKGYFDPNKPEKDSNDYANTAKLDWEWPVGINGTPPTPPFAIKRPGDAVYDNTQLVQKTAGTYDYDDRAIHWTVTVNPYYVNLSSITLVEELTTDEHSFIREKKGDAPPIDIDAAIKALKDSVEDGLNAVGATATVAVKQTADGKLTIDITDIEYQKEKGPKSFSFKVVTYVNKPEIWANNIDKVIFPNKVTVESATIVGKDPISPQDMFATADAEVPFTMLSKSSTNYDAAAKELTWTIKLNEKCAPVTNPTKKNIDIVDTLPDGLSYKSATLRIGEGEPTDLTLIPEKLENGKSKVTFTIPEGTNLTQGATITLVTTVDVDKLNAKGDTSFTNSLSMDPFEYTGSALTPSCAATLVETVPLDKTGSEDILVKEEGGITSKYIEYTVALNPMGKNLLKEGSTMLTVKDKLSAGLLLDLDSVELSEGKQNVDNNGKGDGNGKYTTTLSQGDWVQLAPDKVSYTLNSDGTSLLSVEIPEIDKPYILAYTAYVTKTGTLTNNVVLEGISDNVGTGSGGVTHNYETNGGARLWLPRSVQKNYYSFGVKKVDTAGHPIKNGICTFSLYKDLACTELLTTGKVDPDTGVCEFNLLKTALNGAQTLYLKETTPPDGYNGFSDIITIDLGRLQDIEVVNVKNGSADGNKGVIRLRKVDAEHLDVEIEGVVFGLYENRDDKNAYKTATTNADGIAEFTNLTHGKTYYVKELSAPDRYVVSEEIIEVLPGTSNSDSIVITNELAKSTISVAKVDSETGLPIFDTAKFGLYPSEQDAKDETNLIATEYTNDGVADFTDLRPGETYWLKEETAPEHYVHDTDPKEIKITVANGYTQGYTFENERARNVVNVFKYFRDETHPIEGVRFGLYDNEDCTGKPIQDEKTDKNGKVQFTNLLAGVPYYVKELSAPHPYISEGEIRDVTVTQHDGEEHLEFFNEKGASVLEITKVDSATKAHLSGAEFKLYLGDLKIGESQPTDKNGIVRFEGLRPNETYRLVETVAPEHHVLIGEPIEVTTDKNNGDVTRLQVENPRATTEIEILKLDAEDNSPIRGVTFGLYETDDCQEDGFLDKAITNENGVATFTNFRSGVTYYAKELETPAAYVRRDDVYHVKPHRDPDIEDRTVVFNERAKAAIEVTKVDSNDPNHRLSGAAFKLYTDSTCTVQVGEGQITNGNGIALFTGLQPNTSYFLKETQAPGGYRLPAEGQIVTTGNNVETPIPVVVKNTRSSTGGGTGPVGPGRPTLPDVPDSGLLNTEDHYSYIIGYPDGSVQPEGTITRGEVATIFFRLLTDEVRDKYWCQSNGYTDVPAKLWSCNAISTLSNMGIIDGYPDGAFRPEGRITRAEFAKIAVSFFEETAKEYTGTFPDVAASAWYASYVEAAARIGLVEGYNDGSFQPEKIITRAEACTIVNRALGRKPHKDHLLPLPVMVNWPDCARDAWYYAAMMEATNSHDYEWILVGSEEFENWTEKLPQRDWEALEKIWSESHSAPGGEVVD